MCEAKKSPFGQPKTTHENALLRLQLRQEDEFALVGFAAVEDVLIEERADGAVRGAGLRRDLLKLLLHRADDLAIDRLHQRAAGRFRGPRPQEVHGADAERDGADGEEGKGEADADAQNATSGSISIIPERGA